jgi:hypothetical protein
VCLPSTGDQQLLNYPFMATTSTLHKLKQLLEMTLAARRALSSVGKVGLKGCHFTSKTYLPQLLASAVYIAYRGV